MVSVGSVDSTGSSRVSAVTGWDVSNPGGPSVGGSISSAGEIGDLTQIRGGGVPGAGINQLDARGLLLPGIVGGGGGGGSKQSHGGNGGGTLVILAKGGISNGAGALIAAFGANRSEEH